MKEMRDSTEAARNGQELRARMREEGYLLIRGVIDQELLGQVRSDVLGTLHRAGWIAADGSLKPLVNGQEDPRYWDGFAGVQAVESFHRMAFDSRLQAIMSALAGPDVYPWPGKSPYIMWPEGMGGANTKPHQEGCRWSTDILSTWVSLGQTPVQQGGLAVLPETQSVGYLDDYGYGKFEFGPDWVTASFEPGDIVIFHNFTVHGSLRNQTDSLRLSCAFKWQSAGHPAPAEAALPVRYPQVPDWDSLTAGWSSRRWVTPPPGATFLAVPPGQPVPSMS
ncbi:MAG TPA: phytanoyl-CoA dioxygenase family protein [Streptosporangiaceae bacterium]